MGNAGSKKRAGVGARAWQLKKAWGQCLATRPGVWWCVRGSACGRLPGGVLKKKVRGVRVCACACKKLPKSCVCVQGHVCK